MKVIGLISGTSADAIDAALVDIQGAPPALAVRLLSFLAVPFTTSQREQIFGLFDPATSTVDRICQMNFAIGRWFAEAALALMAEARIEPEEVDLIGSHGQTIYHSVDSDSPVRSTLQIGEAAVIAERTGITTVADFRVADVAAGGQGAPLASYLDWLLLRHPTHHRASQNIGGIGNVTYLPPGDDPSRVLALDTGPGNALIDYAASQATDGALTFDRGGRLASQGRVSEALVAELMAHPYFTLPLPKTTGREQFGVAFAAQAWAQGEALGLAPADIVASLTAFTAASIADAYRRYLPAWPDEVILGGGGAANPTLVAMLKERLAVQQTSQGATSSKLATKILSADELGLSSDMKEAIAFAVIAYEAIHGRAGVLPSCTGARHAAVLGKITPGRNFHRLLAPLGARA